MGLHTFCSTWNMQLFSDTELTEDQVEHFVRGGLTGYLTKGGERLAQIDGRDLGRQTGSQTFAELYQHSPTFDKGIPVTSA